MDERIVILGGGCFGGGLFAFFWGLRYYQRKRLMQNTPTSKVEAVALGLAELCGHAVPQKPMLSPIEQLPCVYWRFKVEEYKESGRSKSWATIDHGEGRVPFYIEDDTGKILVVPTGATIDVPRSFYEDTSRIGLAQGLSPCTIVFAEQRGIVIDSTFTNSTRFTEWIIVPDDPLFVFGTVVAVEDQLAGLSKTEDRIVCCDPANRFFFIANRSSREVETKFAWKAAAGVIGGGLLAVAGLAILLGLYHLL